MRRSSNRDDGVNITHPGGEELWHTVLAAGGDNCTALATEPAPFIAGKWYADASFLLTARRFALSFPAGSCSKH